MQDQETRIPGVYMNRADGGKHAQSFLTGGYAAIGWLNDTDLGDLRNSDVVYELLQTGYPDESVNTVRSWAGSVCRFIFDMQPGDHVLTPDLNRRWLWHGRIASDYLWTANPGECPYRHRRLVQRGIRPIDRYQLPTVIQQTLGSGLTVFYVATLDLFLERVYSQSE